MAEPTLKLWAEVFGLPVVGVIATKAFDWWIARQTRAAAKPAEETKAQAELLEAAGKGSKELVEALSALLDDYKDQLDFVRADNRRLTARVEELAAKLSASESGHADCLKIVTALRLELDETLGRLPFTPPLQLGKSTT